MKSTNWLLNRHVLGALCSAPLLFSSASVLADDAAPAAEAVPAVEAAPAVAAAPAEPASPWTFTMNLGLYSEYMFRGVSLSDGPALQGGADLGHSSGFYVGTWFSNIDAYYYGRNKALGTDGNKYEVDFYGGYAHTFENGFGVNVLGNYYKYFDGERANNFLDDTFAFPAIRQRKQDSFEASIALSYKWLTYTYYNVLTDYYGLDRTNKDFIVTKKGDTDGAEYHELKVNYTLPIGDLNFMAKVGYQRTPGLQGSQGDMAIGLNRNFSLPAGGKPIEGFNAGGYYTNTFNVDNEAFYVTADGRDVNEEKIWFFVKRTW